MVHKADFAGVRQFRETVAGFFNEGIIDFYRQQVRAGEVAVVVGFFLGAHGAGFVTVAVIQAGFLHDAAAVFQNVHLPLNFVGNGLLHEPERVQVLGFGTCAQSVGPLRFQRNIHVETHGALGHVAVADAQGCHDAVQLLREGDGFFRVVHIRFGDHLNERCAGPVEIHAGHAVEILMQGFAGILFQVGVVNANALGLTVRQINVHEAGADNRALQLSGLIAFGQIRVEVVFPLEHGAALDLRIHCQAKHDRIAESLLVGDRQRAGHGQVNGVGLRVRLGAVSGAGA